MDFGLSNEQQMIIDSVKSFVEKELYPHEDEVEKSNKIKDSVVEKIKQKAIESVFMHAICLKFMEEVDLIH